MNAMQMTPSVLVVEDEDSLATLLQYNLQKEGYEVALAGDGEEALLMVEERLPDLIVLDWMLPKVSGIEVCRRLRQPMADDLRRTVAAMKVANNLERCGDLAKNIAKRTLVIIESDPLTPLTRSIERMGKLVLGRLSSVLDAYSRSDIERAIAVWSQDDEVDEHYNSLFRELLTYMMGDPRTITACAHMLFVAKNLERIGDHATNIAEIVHYEITGEEMISERPKTDALKPAS